MEGSKTRFFSHPRERGERFNWSEFLLILGEKRPAHIFPMSNKKNNVISNNNFILELYLLELVGLIFFVVAFYLLLHF